MFEIMINFKINQRRGSAYFHLIICIQSAIKNINRMLWICDYFMLHMQHELN